MNSRPTIEPMQPFSYIGFSYKEIQTGNMGKDGKQKWDQD